MEYTRATVEGLMNQMKAMLAGIGLREAALEKMLA